jgi:ATP synthase protein I
MKPFINAVGEQEARKLRARGEPVQGIWFGLGMFGLVGWSVALPTLFGAWVGVRLDERYPGTHSYTLTFLVVGLLVGIATAGYWVADENRKIHG